MPDPLLVRIERLEQQVIELRTGIFGELMPPIDPKEIETLETHGAVAQDLEERVYFIGAYYNRHPTRMPTKFFDETDGVWDIVYDGVGFITYNDALDYKAKHALRSPKNYTIIIAWARRKDLRRLDANNTNY